MKKHYTREGGILVCLFLGIFILFATTTSSRITLETKIRVETLKSDLTTVKRLNENEGVKAVFTWTIMVYMAADNDLEDAGVEDLSEMKNSYLGSEICLVVEFDGWDSCLQQETDDLQYNMSQRFRVPGAGGAFINLDNMSQERNMGDAQTLSSFIEFAMNQFPADNYCLILWNHGLGWETGVEDWREYTSSTRRSTSNFPQGLQRILNTRQKSVCVDDRSFGDALTEEELQSAFSKAPEELDIIAFDACLMGCVEVAYALRNYAQYMVASEDSMGLSGFYYRGFLDELNTRISSGSASSYDSKSCANLIVEETIDNLYSYPDLSKYITQLGVIDLTKMQGVSEYISDLAEIIFTMGSSQVKEVCEELSFFAEFELPEQIDILHVLHVIDMVTPGATDSFGDNLKNQLLEAQGFQWVNASLITSGCGLTIYSPWSKELWIANYSNVTAFGRDTGWDEVVARLCSEADPYDSSDFILSHDNPSITTRIKENEIATIFLSLHWKEQITLRLSGPGYTDFDFYLYDLESNLLDESNEEDYPEKISHTAYEGSESFILLIHAYQGNGDFSLKATYSTSNALLEFLGCVNMFVTDTDNNTKIDDIQLVLAFDSPSSATVKFQLKVIDHTSSIILEWNQKFIEGTEITILDLPYEELYQQIETLLPTQRWECLTELSIIEPSNWKYTFHDDPLVYLIKLADLDQPIDNGVVVTPGQIIEVVPLNSPRDPLLKPKDYTFELIVLGMFSLVMVGGIGYWIMTKRLKTAYPKEESFHYVFTAKKHDDDIQSSAVCPECGVVYQLTKRANLCPTCQVSLQAIIPITSTRGPFFCGLCGKKHNAGTPRMECPTCVRSICVDQYSVLLKAGKKGKCPDCGGNLEPVE